MLTVVARATEVILARNLSGGAPGLMARERVTPNVRPISRRALRIPDAGTGAYAGLWVHSTAGTPCSRLAAFELLRCW